MSFNYFFWDTNNHKNLAENIAKHCKNYEENYKLCDADYVVHALLHPNVQQLVDAYWKLSLGITFWNKPISEFREISWAKLIA